jgi:ADP-ribose pyrophosphatase YjhB (NUDIX family)
MQEDHDTTDKQRIVAKALIRRSDGRLLLLRRAPDPLSENALKYNPPGGAVEVGESLAVALRRAVLEETRLEILIGGIVGVNDWHGQYRKAYYVGIFYSCKLVNQSAEIILNHENCEYAWVSKENLANLNIMDASRHIIERYLASTDPPQLPYQELKPQQQ